MNLGQINLNYLWIFETVYRCRSMTLAAKELRLTQSGVSQHIQTFEEQVGEKLFDRINQKLVPTQFAVQLNEKIKAPLFEIKNSLNEILNQKHGLQGIAKIGIPMEFGNNIILPLLAEFQRKHPRVSFAIQVGLSEEINEALSSGNLDFAFVDSFVFDRKIETQEVYEEILDLVILQSEFELIQQKGVSEMDILFGKMTKKQKNKLRFVDYQQNESVLRLWFKHHFKSEPKDIPITAVAENVQSVVSLILNRVGAGVIPHHVTTKLQQTHSLHSFSGNGERFKNTISLALLRGKSHSPLTKELIQFLLEKMKAMNEALKR